MSEKHKIIENLIQELKRGTLVLSVLLNTNEPTYGYSLVQSLQSQGVDVEQNTLYPLLRRLEKQGLLTSHWDTSESRPRKYYTRSQLGFDVSESLAIEWNQLNSIIQQMIINNTGGK